MLSFKFEEIPVMYNKSSYDVNAINLRTKTWEELSQIVWFLIQKLSMACETIDNLKLDIDTLKHGLKTEIIICPWCGEGILRAADGIALSLPSNPSKRLYKCNVCQKEIFRGE